MTSSTSLLRVFHVNQILHDSVQINPFCSPTLFLPPLLPLKHVKVSHFRQNLSPSFLQLAATTGWNKDFITYPLQALKLKRQKKITIYLSSLPRRVLSVCRDRHAVLNLFRATCTPLFQFASRHGLDQDHNLLQLGLCCLGCTRLQKSVFFYNTVTYMRI